MKKNYLWWKQWAIVLGLLMTVLSVNAIMPKNAAG